MRTWGIVMAFALVVGGWGCQGAHHSTGDVSTEGAGTSSMESEEDIPLDRVPAAVKQAALDAKPGIQLTEAERETENGVIVYELEGTLNGVKWEIEVSSSGQVIETEKAGSDDDGDDDGDDDDDDDDDDD